MGKTLFASSGDQIVSSKDQFHYRLVEFYSHLKYQVGNILAKDAGLCSNLNIDVTPIVSRAHTHTSHSQTSLLLTSSLFLGVPVTHVTQCR
jgi:hypothetical protein